MGYREVIYHGWTIYWQAFGEFEGGWKVKGVQMVAVSSLEKAKQMIQRLERT